MTNSVDYETRKRTQHRATRERAERLRAMTALVEAVKEIRRGSFVDTEFAAALDYALDARGFEIRAIR